MPNFYVKACVCWYNLYEGMKTRFSFSNLLNANTVNPCIGKSGLKRWHKNCFAPMSKLKFYKL